MFPISAYFGSEFPFSVNTKIGSLYTFKFESREYDFFYLFLKKIIDQQFLNHVGLSQWASGS